MKNTTDKKLKLGIDIGRVIMAPVVGGKSDTSFLTGGIEQAMQTPPSPNAIESIIKLINLFNGNVWLVSKAGVNTQNKTLLWLDHREIYQETGLSRDNVRFCRKRHEKAGHCKELGITHFIDDRIDVLKHLKYIVPNLYLFGEQPKLDYIPGWVQHVNDWNEARDNVIKDCNN